MGTYCDINNINKNMQNDNDDLDYLARQVNNSKKNKTRDIYDNYRGHDKSLHDGIEAFNNLNIANHDKGTYIKPDNINSGFYSAQGEYSEYKPKLCGTSSKDIYTKTREDTEKSISIDTPDSLSESSDFSTLSTITCDTHEIDKEIINKSKFKTKKNKRHTCLEFDLDSVESLESLESGESLLRHIRFCQDCKNKVIDLVRRHKIGNLEKLKKSRNANSCLGDYTENYQKNKIHEINDDKNDNTDNAHGLFGLDLKEIITVCLIGFLIIFLLDLMMRR